MEFKEPTDAGIDEQGPMRLNQVWICDPGIPFNDHRTIGGNRHIPANVHHPGIAVVTLMHRSLTCSQYGTLTPSMAAPLSPMARMSVARVETGFDLAAERMPVSISTKALRPPR